MKKISIIVSKYIRGPKRKNLKLFFLLTGLFVLLIAKSDAYEFKVQRGVVTLSGTSVTLSAPSDFTAVSGLDKAFVRITNSQHTGAGRDAGGGSQNADDVTACIYFTAPDTIIVRRIGTGTVNTRVCWEIIEYIGPAGGINEFTVRAQGIHTFAAGAITETLSFSGASSVSSLAGFVTGVMNPDTGRRDYETGLVTLSFDDSATLRFTRGNAGNDAITVSYAVVDFTGSAWTIQRVEHTYSAAGSPETETISSVPVGHTFIHTQKRNVSDLRGLDEFGHQVWLSANNQISFQLRSSATNPSGQTSVAWIISNPYMNVYRNNGTIPSGGAEPQTGTMSFPAVADLSNASIFWNNDCNGTGTAYPRPIIAVRLINTDTLEYWRSDTGQPQDCRYEIVQWPQTPSFRIDGTVYTDETKTTTIGAGKTIALSVNGASPTTTTTDSGGAFTFYTNVNPNDVIMTYMDNAVDAGWTAYHALFSGASGKYITKGNGGSDLPVTPLIDHSDGAATGVNIAIHWIDYTNTLTNNGDKDPAAGTDAYNTFDGNIDLDDQFAYYYGSSNYDFLTVTFSNVDPSKKYTVALYNSAGGYSSYSTQFHISGISSAVNASSSGVHVTDNYTVDYSIDNTSNGYIAKWTDIVPSGTSFTITCSSYGSTVGLAPQAIMLQQQPQSTSDFATLVTVTDGITDLTGANALQMVRGDIILEYQTGTSITNSQLATVANADPENDDGISVTGSDVTFITDKRVWISSGKNYVPGGDITLGSLHISGTLTLSNETVSVYGDWVNDESFVCGNSTVTFTGSSDTSIFGNTTFYNFRCLTANKIISVEEGSSQTISGLFRIDGGTSGSRIILKSSGGTGTTWNLVLNGRHDVRYVGVQGSHASGSAWLPIDPVGYRNDGDNVNWYGTSTPRELIFKDNFETSTSGAKPPDKESSHWTIEGASAWYTENGEVVSTHNHTSGGSFSMYSRGGASGEGVGCWNYPGWGPQTNVAAECWFYDDMQSPKHQWMSIDNYNGYNWLALVIKTTEDPDKYLYRGSMTGGFQPTYIDRKLGWHHVQWIRDSLYTSLYLDGVRVAQVDNSSFSDFTDFDCGTFSWDNNGSTGLWTDDFIVYRGQHQEKYRWYENDSAENPSALAGEDTRIVRNRETVTRLRIQIQNDENQDWSGKYIGLQYRLGTGGTWTDFGPTADWDYADGLGNDGNQIGNALLSGTDVKEYFVESVPSSPNLNLASGKIGEWDFCVTATSNATIGATYYIRAVETDSSGNFLKSLVAYPYLPECEITSPTLWTWTGASNNNWNTGSNWSKGTPPNSTSDVVIPASASRDCRVNISGAVCNSMIVESGRTLLLDTASTSLLIEQDMTVQGTVTHSSDSCEVTVNSGEIIIDGGTYNHSGDSTVNAKTEGIRVLNHGNYNLTGAGTINAKNIILEAFGYFANTGSTASLNIENMDIQAGAQFRCTVTDTAFNVGGNFTNDGSMSGTTGGKWRFYGSGKTLSSTSVTTIFYNFSVTGSLSVSNTDPIIILNEVNIASGASLTLTSGTFRVGGYWVNSGTFNAGTSTVEFNGTSLQRVTTDGASWYKILITNSSSGGIQFDDPFSTQYFEDSTPASHLTFKAGATYTITASGGLTLTGSSGNNIVLRSTSAGTRWLINPAGGGWNVDYVDVQDSFNIHSDAIMPSNYTDSGNNLNWFIQDEDADGDELPDWWEYRYYGSFGTNASTDTDGDGLSAFEEYVIESNPTDAKSPTTIYVDADAYYSKNDGSSSYPYKYLSDALDAASEGSYIKLAAGTYALQDYLLTKNIIIKGDKPTNTFIKGPLYRGVSSDKGRMVTVESTRFILSNATLRLYKDDCPIIAYNPATSEKVVFKNLIFRDNELKTKAIIAPIESAKSCKLYLLNSLFYRNAADSAIKIDASEAKIFCNTIPENKFATTAIHITGSGETYITNNILRGTYKQIFEDGTGKNSVSYCNIQGGFPGAVNSYDSTPKFIDTGNGYYRILGRPDEDAGTNIFVTWDMDDFPRPEGSAFDVGAYELQPTDTDGDGLTNTEESSYGTNSSYPDTDKDGISDYDEVKVYGTDPADSNTDGDEVNDGDEIEIGMDPTVSDGTCVVDVFDESFEDTSDYPEGDWANTKWGKVNSAFGGNIQIKTVGTSQAYDGSRVGILYGQIPESYNISLIQRNGLEDYWISWAFKLPRAKLPTNVNEAINIAGAYLAVDENGYLCIFDGAREQWIRDTRTIPNNTWVNFVVHRNHSGKYVDVWVDGRAVFSHVTIFGIDPDDYIRFSFSSVGEYDVWIDKLVGYRNSPF